MDNAREKIVKATGKAGTAPTQEPGRASEALARGAGSRRGARASPLDGRVRGRAPARELDPWARGQVREGAEQPRSSRDTAAGVHRRQSGRVLGGRTRPDAGRGRRGAPGPGAGSGPEPASADARGGGGPGSPLPAETALCRAARPGASRASCPAAAWTCGRRAAGRGGDTAPGTPQPAGPGSVPPPPACPGPSRRSAGARAHPGPLRALDAVSTDLGSWAAGAGDAGRQRRDAWRRSRGDYPACCLCLFRCVR